MVGVINNRWKYGTRSCLVPRLVLGIRLEVVSCFQTVNCMEKEENEENSKISAIDNSHGKNQMD